MVNAVRDGLKRFKSGGPGYLLARHEALPSRPDQKRARRQLSRGTELARARTAPERRRVRARRSARRAGNLGGPRCCSRPYPRAIRGRARWELVYRLPRGASFRFQLGNDQTEVNGKTKGAKPVKPGHLAANRARSGSVRRARNHRGVRLAAAVRRDPRRQRARARDRHPRDQRRTRVDAAGLGRADLRGRGSRPALRSPS